MGIFGKNFDSGKCWLLRRFNNILYLLYSKLKICYTYNLCIFYLNFIFWRRMSDWFSLFLSMEGTNIFIVYHISKYSHFETTFFFGITSRSRYNILLLFIDIQLWRYTNVQAHYSLTTIDIRFFLSFYILYIISK